MNSKSSPFWIILILVFIALVALTIASEDLAIISAPLIPACMAVGSFYLGYTKLMEALASKSWPSVEGEITESDLHMKRYSGNDRETKHKFSFRVKYQYTVDGEFYENNRYSFKYIFLSGTLLVAQTLVEKNPVGCARKVFYNPEDPQDSVLLTGANIFSYVPFILGVFFTWLTFVLFQAMQNI